MQTSAPVVQIVVENHGSVFLFRPTTAEAMRHLNENCRDSHWFGGAMVVQPIYVDTLVEKLGEDGFSLGAVK